MNNKSTYIIAEAGVNHNGSIDIAKQLIDVAAESGANAVKFQTFKAEKLVSRSAPKAEYQTKTTDASELQFDMIKKLELDEKAHKQLVVHCRKRGIQFLSTPFDFESVELLAKVLDLPFLKIPSGEITNAPLLLKAARTGKPIILSTGMSTLGEIESALGVLAFGYLGNDEKPSIKAFRDAYCTKEGQLALREKVTLLHCTTEYPAPFSDVNLRAMGTMKAAFGLPVGISDHTPGITVPIAAAALGAVIVEKHFTVDRDLPGPDHRASLEPDELKSMVSSIRQVELALGSGLKISSASELGNMKVARKSLVASDSIKKGEVFTEKNISVKRPGTGTTPFRYWDLLGKTACRDYPQDENIE